MKWSFQFFSNLKHYHGNKPTNLKKKNNKIKLTNSYKSVLIKNSVYKKHSDFDKLYSEEDIMPSLWCASKELVPTNQNIIKIIIIRVSKDTIK